MSLLIECEGENTIPRFDKSFLKSPLTMSQAMKPHGLIKTPWLELMYREAFYRDYDGKEPKENSTVQLMEDICNKILFVEPEFTVNSQVPPTKHSNKACDIVIHYFPGGGTYQKRILCFVECKRRSSNTPKKILQLEEQAEGYAGEFLKDPSNVDVPYVYVVTAAGAHIRLWKYDLDNGLVAFWENSELDNWSAYKDVGDDKDGAELESYFNMMKSTPPEPREGQSYSMYGASMAPVGYIQQTASIPQWVELSGAYNSNGQYYFQYNLGAESCSDWTTAWEPRDDANGGSAFWNRARNVWARSLPQPPATTRSNSEYQHVVLTLGRDQNGREYYSYKHNGKTYNEWVTEWKQYYSENGSGFCNPKSCVYTLSLPLT